MTTEETLRSRAEGKCELCGAEAGLVVFQVPPKTNDAPENCILMCATCRDQIEHPAQVDVHHWRCLNESMWNQSPAVQVMAWRMLKNLKSEAWARDLFDMLFLEEETLAWAKAGSEDETENLVKHLDSNGAILCSGDAVTLIKDLNVKGAGFTAKRGTVVRNISLVQDNAGQIEGRVNSQQIVILTEFVKKSG